MRAPDEQQTRETIDAAGSGGQRRRRPSTQAPPRGESIGRFIMLDRLGSGGMGQVVSAYDPRLDRRVAIKLLHAGGEPGDTEASRARLIREARAMAQIRHPNVLTVYEVGTFADQVFVAMEYVAGGNLREHVEGHPEMGWQDIVSLYATAARGLAAAHEAGMVHRDFKPDNVLIEGDHVQVADFGLVGIADEESPGEHNANDGDTTSDALTRTGSIMGTVAYMAPEQHRGEPADARADQYAFCVSLYQALFKKHPFGDPRGADFVDRKLTGQVAPAPDSTAVPAWVRAAIVRGFSVEPGERYDSMTELLAVLEPQRDEQLGRRSRKIFTLVMGGSFTIMPILSGELGIPFPMETTSGAAGLMIGLVVLFAVVTWTMRAFVLATAYNRAVVSVVGVVLGAELLAHWGMTRFGVPMRQAGAIHICYWAASAWIFALVVERRALAAALGYTASAAIAILRPDLVFFMMSAGGLVLVVNVALIWRDAPRPAGDSPATAAAEPTAHGAPTVPIRPPADPGGRR